MPTLVHIGSLATCRAAGPQAEIHAIPHAALAWEGDRIVWVGPEAELPDRYRDDVLDAGGRLVVPGLTDCHTHLAFGGNRADEWAAKLRGASYLEIAASGGGIRRTVRETAAAPDDELRSRALGFLAEMQRLGVTTAEVKSGYGLTVDAELRLLRIYRDIAPHTPVRLVPTLLAAHAIPHEYTDRREAYLDLLCDELIPAAAADRLARFCDAFVERGAFTVDEARRVLTVGKAHGLAPKLHADQLTDGGGASLAAELGAVSADHLEHTGAAGIRAMADAGTVAVSLPIATMTLAEPPFRARPWLDAGVPVAVATDFNPGSATCYDLPLALYLACQLQRMTPTEALKGATIHAARAVGLADRIGSLEVGKQADFVLIDAADVTDWFYPWRGAAVSAVWIGGVRCP